MEEVPIALIICSRTGGGCYSADHICSRIGNVDIEPIK